MLYNSARELKGLRTEVLNYGYGRNINGDLVSTVKNEKGEIQFSTTYTPNADYMLVTDYRNGKVAVKREQISVSTTLQEIENDMRTLGYLTANQRLQM